MSFGARWVAAATFEVFTRTSVLSPSSSLTSIRNPNSFDSELASTVGVPSTSVRASSVACFFECSTSSFLEANVLEQTSHVAVPDTDLARLLLLPCLRLSAFPLTDKAPLRVLTRSTMSEFKSMSVHGSDESEHAADLMFVFLLRCVFRRRVTPAVALLFEFRPTRSSDIKTRPMLH